MPLFSKPSAPPKYDYTRSTVTVTRSGLATAAESKEARIAAYEGEPSGPEYCMRERELSSLLECPICFSIPEGIIFNCEKGHSICATCRKQLSRCALCAHPYTDARNFLVESLISYLSKVDISVNAKMIPNPILQNCINKAEGCNALLHSNEMKQHAMTCEYRPAKCNVESSNKCSSPPVLKLSEIFGHLRQHHKINGLASASGVFTKIDRLFVGIDINVTWPPFYLEYDGRIFLRYASIRSRNVHWWIQMIGTDKEADKYQAQISLQSPNKKLLKISWTVPVHSIRRTRQEIEFSRGLASLSTKRVLPYCLLNDRFGDKVATHMWSCKIIISRI